VTFRRRLGRASAAWCTNLRHPGRLLDDALAAVPEWLGARIEAGPPANEPEVDADAGWPPALGEYVDRVAGFVMQMPAETTPADDPRWYTPALPMPDTAVIGEARAVIAAVPTEPEPYGHALLRWWSFVVVRLAESA
jgi:hypothetical protein